MRTKDTTIVNIKGQKLVKRTYIKGPFIGEYEYIHYIDNIVKEHISQRNFHRLMEIETHIQSFRRKKNRKVN